MMKFKNNSFKAIGWIALSTQILVSGYALAQDNASTTSVEQKSTWDKVKEKLYLNYFGEFNGPSTATLSNPDPKGNLGDPINLESFVSAGYRFQKKWIVDATADFTYSPFGKTAGVVNPLDSPFLMKDPFVRVQTTQKFGNLTLWGDLRSYIPASTASQGSSLVTGFRNTLFTDYQIGNSRWTAGHYSILRGNIYGGAGDGTGYAFGGLFSLHTNYQFHPKVSMALWADLINAKVDRLGNGNLAAADFQAGVSWDITPKINFNPYIQVYPGTMSLSSTSLNFLLNVNVF